MEREPGVELAQPEWLVRADHVHVVAAVGERLPQLGCEDAAPAHRGVTHDAGIHF
jgi:hypothetical protein